MKKLSAVFFDRDNTLTVDRGYTHRLEDFQWISGAPKAVKMLNDMGVLVFLVTNQAGVARGYFKCEDVERFNKHLEKELVKYGAHLDDVKYCPHHIDGVVEAYRKKCSCRKPEPGMILRLIDKWGLDPGRCMLIGDSVTDVAAGEASGIASHKFEGKSLLKFLKECLDVSG